MYMYILGKLSEIQNIYDLKIQMTKTNIMFS